MSRVKVKCEVQVYEVQGEDVPVGASGPPLTTESHWNRDEFVVVKFNKQEFTVVGSDLITAIKNAMNTK